MKTRNSRFPICINRNCNLTVTKSGKTQFRPVCWKCHLASYGARPLEEGIEMVKEYDHQKPKYLKEYLDYEK